MSDEWGGAGTHHSSLISHHLRGALTGLGLATAAGAGLYRLALRQPRTAMDGVVSPPGVRTDVEIVRDRAGVPHIYAATSYDVYYALGYVHAQDRLWHMELNRRVALGRLSEIFGEIPLLFDRFMRRLGLGRVAALEAEAADPVEREALEGYAAGVNGFLATHRHRLPLEFRILRFRPRPWEPADSLAWGKAMSWFLAANWDTEWFRARLVEQLGPEVAAALDPGYPSGHPVTAEPGAGYAGAVDTLIAGFQAVQRELGLVAGGMSNAWAVAPERSATGAALLASDPHLRPQMPSIWYEAHLCGGGLDVVGATLPGAPAVLIGHNRDIAWGVTASMVDAQDLFVERLDPGDPNRYATPDGWEPLGTRIETIQVRGRAEPVVEEVQETRHGPAISPLLRGENRFLALASPLLQPHHPMRAAITLNRARDWHGFRDALREWDVPINFVYADRAGNIGYQLCGMVPRRRKGTGLLPAPGWDAVYDWDGLIPFDELPSTFNPPCGYVVSANNRVVGDDYPHALSHDWIDGFRAMRIESELGARERHTIDDFAAMQMDVTCETARQLVALFEDVVPIEPLAVRALEHLRRWDFRLTAGSVPGAIYEVLRERLLRNVFGPRLGRLLGPYAGTSPGEGIAGSAYPARVSSILIRALQEEDPSWLSPEAGITSWPELKRLSLSQAVLDLRARLGDDMDTWEWGRLHQVSFDHPLGRVKPLNLIFNRGPYPVGGDGDTPHQSSGEGGTYAASGFLPSYRQIVDLGDLKNSWSIHTTGQSGLPGDPHYDDFIPLWRDGRYHRMLFDRRQILDDLEHLLVLRPR